MNRKIILTLTMIFLLFTTTSCWFEIEEFFLFGGEQKSWQEKAIEKRDYTICEKASMPDVCRMAYAKEYRDRNACLEIINEATRNRCIMQAEYG